MRRANFIGTKSGGGSSVTRLFNADSLMKQIAPPEVRGWYFVFKKGENKVVIKYKKTDSNSKELTVKLEMQDYSDPLLSLSAKDAEGTIERTIDIEPAQSAGFKPIVIER